MNPQLLIDAAGIGFLMVCALFAYAAIFEWLWNRFYKHKHRFFEYLVYRERFKEWIKTNRDRGAG